jgi:hypothetical protein
MAFAYRNIIDRDQTSVKRNGSYFYVYSITSPPVRRERVLMFLAGKDKSRRLGILGKPVAFCKNPISLGASYLELA